MPLLITGHQRSGTTLLMRVCNSHPAVQITGEFGNFYRLNVPYGEYVRFIWKRWLDKRNASFIYTRKRSIKGLNMAQNLGFILQYLAHLHRRRQPTVGVKTIDAALHGMYPGRQIVGDKYPDYAFQLETLSSRERVCCLFIYRDPRDVAASSVKRARTDWQDHWPAELRDPLNIARRWVTFIELLEAHPASVYPVRYEDLVRSPAETAAGIARWLSLDPAGFDTGIVRGDSIGKHAHGLTEAELAGVLAIAGPAMERVGYEL